MFVIYSRRLKVKSLSRNLT